ncbi:histone-lysine N-methyltransferase SETMAR [Trichonephila clavipes]|nr:histone-lysine N-methyltransferase SETMAR [Trichonephila clavipes]
MIVQFRNEKVSNHGSIPITVDCNVVGFIAFEEGFHQPIKRIKQVLKIEVNKERIRYILQFFFDKGENASQAAEILNGVHDADTVTANYEQVWFRRFRSGIFDVKVAPHLSSKMSIKSQK